jgi:hypothetical protein
MLNSGLVHQRRYSVPEGVKVEPKGRRYGPLIWVVIEAGDFSTDTGQGGSHGTPRQEFRNLLSRVVAIAGACQPLRGGFICHGWRNRSGRESAACG